VFVVEHTKNMEKIKYFYSTYALEKTSSTEFNFQLEIKQNSTFELHGYRNLNKEYFFSFMELLQGGLTFSIGE
jgi:hypothetical protein